MYLISIDNVPCTAYGLYVVKRPSIPSSKRRYTEYEVPGRDGKLYASLETYDDIEIVVTFNYITNKPNDWFIAWRKAKQWLTNDKSNRRLNFSDDLECFRKIKKIEIGENSRESLKIGRFDVVFTVDPYDYLDIGIKQYPYQQIKNNRYTLSKPVYHIEGEGICTLSINGYDLVANVGQQLYIDTDLEIAYTAERLSNTSISGDYKRLYLNHGYNEISVSNGFKLFVTPNWRY